MSHAVYSHFYFLSRHIQKKKLRLLHLPSLLYKQNNKTELRCRINTPFPLSALLFKKANGCNEHPLPKAGWLSSGKHPTASLKTDFHPPSQGLWRNSVFGSQTALPVGSTHFKAAWLWWCWSRLGNVQHRDSFLLRPSQYWKNQSVSYNQWKLLFWRRPPSPFPNKNAPSALSEGGKFWCFPWWPAWVLEEQGSRGGSLCPREEWHTSDISIFSISNWLLQAGSASAW